MAVQTGVLHVLLLTADALQTRHIESLLFSNPDAKIRLSVCNHLDEAIHEFASGTIDLVLLAPDDDSEALAKLQKAAPTLPVIVLLRSNDFESGRQVIQAGAENFLPLDALNGGWLSHAIVAAVERHEVYVARNTQVYEDAKALAALEERQRLARELHDAVTQTLYSSSITAEALMKIGKKEPASVLPHLESLYRLNRSALAEMRMLLLELRPTALANLVLHEQLQHLADSLMGRKAGIQIKLSLNPRGSPPPENVRVTFYRIAQEAMNNVIKHSQAKQVSLLLWTYPERAEMEITDDGVGIDGGKVSGSSLGLNIMRERAAEIGAKLTITSEKTKGTTILVYWEQEQTE